MRAALALAALTASLGTAEAAKLGVFNMYPLGSTSCSGTAPISAIVGEDKVCVQTGPRTATRVDCGSNTAVEHATADCSDKGRSSPLGCNSILGITLELTCKEVSNKDFVKFTARSGTCANPGAVTAVTYLFTTCNGPIDASLTYSTKITVKGDTLTYQWWDKSNDCSGTQAGSLTTLTNECTTNQGSVGSFALATSAARAPSALGGGAAALAAAAIAFLAL